MESTLPNVPISNVISVVDVNESSNRNCSDSENQKSEQLPEESIEQEPEILNEQENLNYWDALYAFVALGTCFALTSPITLIPWHNVFEFPEFWWEGLIWNGVIIPILRMTLCYGNEVYLVFRMDFIKSIRWYLTYCLTVSLAFVTTSCGVYVVWTSYMGYNFPILQCATKSDCKCLWICSNLVSIPSSAPKSVAI